MAFLHHILFVSGEIKVQNRCFIFSRTDSSLNIKGSELVTFEEDQSAIKAMGMKNPMVYTHSGTSVNMWLVKINQSTHSKVDNSVLTTSMHELNNQIKQQWYFTPTGHDFEKNMGEKFSENLPTSQRLEKHCFKTGELQYIVQSPKGKVSQIVFLGQNKIFYFGKFINVGPIILTETPLSTVYNHLLSLNEKNKTNFGQLMVKIGITGTKIEDSETKIILTKGEKIIEIPKNNDPISLNGEKLTLSLKNLDEEGINQIITA